MCQQCAWPFEVLFLGLHQKFIFWGISVRNFGIPGVTMKPWNNPGIFKILGRYSTWSQPHRKILESWYIHLQNPRMNRDKGTLLSFNLPLIETDQARLKRGVSNNNSKGARTLNWGSNTTNINKARSYKLQLFYPLIIVNTSATNDLSIIWSLVWYLAKPTIQYWFEHLGLVIL